MYWNLAARAVGTPSFEVGDRRKEGPACLSPGSTSCSPAPTPLGPPSRSWRPAATIFHLMGVGPGEEFRDVQGRPYAVYRGKPIEALL